MCSCVRMCVCTCLCVCMVVCMCVYVCLCMYVSFVLYICVCVCMLYTFVYKCMWVHVDMTIDIYVSKYECVYTNFRTDLKQFKVNKSSLQITTNNCLNRWLTIKWILWMTELPYLWIRSPFKSKIGPWNLATFQVQLWVPHLWAVTSVLRLLLSIILHDQLKPPNCTKGGQRK